MKRAATSPSKLMNGVSSCLWQRYEMKLKNAGVHRRLNGKPDFAFRIRCRVVY
jgi:hypothetical protein